MLKREYKLRTQKEIDRIRAMPIPRIQLAYETGFSRLFIDRALSGPGNIPDLRKLLGVWKLGE